MSFAVSLALFLVQLAVASTAFVWRCDRRPHFAARLAVGLMGGWLACAALNLVLDGFGILNLAGVVQLRYLAAFVAIVGTLRLCLRLSPSEALFYGCSGYALQNAAHYLYLIASVLLGVSGASMPLELVSFLAAYGIAFAVLARFDARRAPALEVKNVLVICLVTLIVTVALSSFVPVGGSESLLYYAYSLFCALLILFLQYGLLERKTVLTERQMMEELLRVETRQHRMSEEAVALIEMRCHDLKHQLAALDAGSLGSSFLEQTRRAVDAYETLVRVGNPTLDILLSEKALACEKAHVDLNLMVEGASFSFMEASDLCSLFGNAIDNAYEAVSGLSAESRFIRVRTARRSGLLCLHVENPCPCPPAFEDGLPCTTKRDSPALHGFGTKSIRFIAEKYEGSAQMRVEKGLFVLDVALPLPS